MLKKICPVCDLPISATGYCPRCKRVIRKPYLREVNYYLNESHPPSELECEFHNRHLESTVPQRTSEPRASQLGTPQRGISQQKNVQSGTTPGGVLTGGRPVAQNPGSQAGGAGNQVYRRTPVPVGQLAGQRQTTGRYQMNPNGGYKAPAGTAGKKSGTGKSTKVVMSGLFISVAAVFAIVIAGIGNHYIGVSPDTDEAYIEEYDEYDDYFQELTDEEVIAAGTPCLGYSHFPGDSSRIPDTMWDIIRFSSYGYTVNSEGAYTDNYIYEGDASYYEDYRYVNLEDRLTAGMSEVDENYIYQSVSFNLDTATGQLHSYSSYLVSRAASLEFLEEFLHLMELDGVSAEEGQTAAIMEETEAIVGENRNGYVYQGDYIVSIYQSDACLSIQVTCSSDPAEGLGDV